MMSLCPSTLLQIALTVTLYFIVLLSTCSTRKCGLQMNDNLKHRSVLLINVDVKLCQVDCTDESYLFASCHQSSHGGQKTEKVSGSSLPPENHPNVLTKTCGSEVCNGTSQCLDDGCRMVCVEVPSPCDLHSASKSGDLSKVKFVLSQEHPDINCKDWIGRTPLMWAAGMGHAEVFGLLASKGAKLSLVDSLGVNILHVACLGGDVEVVKYVHSQQRADINGRVRCGRTPVMLAAKNGHKEVVEFLVENGAGVSLVDKTGSNILHCACRGEYVEVVRYIISKKMVDINSRERQKKTPLMVAGLRGHRAVIELLVKQGADVSLRDKSSDNILHFACRGGHVEVVKYIISLGTVDINGRGLRKKTPVMVAGRYGHKDVVELLVKSGANLSLRNAHNNDLLNFVCQGGHVEVLKYILLQSLVDINSRGYRKKTPIMVAGRRGHGKVVELLIQNGANLSLTDKSGDNILHYASRGGHVEVLKYVLLNNTENINSRGYSNNTPVMLAGRHGHKDVVELLVKYGANLSLRNAHSDNILHLACRGGYVDVVKYVLSQGKEDINSRGIYNRTPVLVAGRWGNEHVVELLVGYRANLSLRDAYGYNILHLGCNEGHVKVLNYVLSQNTEDIDSRENNKKTPVMIAGEKGHGDVVELLVKYAANLSLRDARNDNILHLACRGGHVGVVQYVLSKKIIDINSRGNDNRTAVMVAGRWGHEDVVESLTDHRANLSLRDARGHNILHLGSYGGHVEVLKYVLSQNTVGLNSRRNDNKTPVMVAGERGHKDVVELLVNYGANLSLRDCHSDNILHLACRGGHVSVVEYVLSQGTVDLNAKNEKGESAAAIAKTLGRRHVLELLLSHGANI